MVYSTFLEAIFTLLFFFFLMEQHIVREEQGMECDEENCKKQKRQNKKHPELNQH